MNLTAPERAPARDDLPWLRRRTTRAAPGAGAGPSTGGIDYSATRRAAPPGTPQTSATVDLSSPAPAQPPSQPQASSNLDLSAPSASSPQASSNLDLSAPSASPPQTSSDLDLSAPSASPPQASSNLDLSAPSASAPQTSSNLELSADTLTPPASPQQPSSNLDLSPHDADAPAGPARAEDSISAPVAAVRYQAARTRDGLPTILTTKEPVVTLTRVQSGVGALTIEAVISESVGDLRMGCAYQLVSGQSSVIHHRSGLRVAPPGSRRPVIIAASGFGELTIDLAQNRELERLVVFAHSESGATLSWDGTLVAQTYGGARVEVPLQREPGQGVLVPLSLYNIDGEFVLRAEQSLIAGSIREATTAFGFEGISWLDDHTALS